MMIMPQLVLCLTLALTSLLDVVVSQDASNDDVYLQRNPFLPVVVHLPFRAARAYARTLDFETEEEWNEWSETKLRPFYIPKRPDVVYEEKGWKGWQNWLVGGKAGSPAPSKFPIPSPSNLPVPVPSTTPIPAPTTPEMPAPVTKPTPDPTFVPSAVPSSSPTSTPSAVPSSTPSSTPSAVPSAVPSSVPTAVPSAVPSSSPTAVPSAVPSATPTSIPTEVPSSAPTNLPVPAPTDAPSGLPAPAPTNAPSDFPTLQPTVKPTAFECTDFNAIVEDATGATCPTLAAAGQCDQFFCPTCRFAGLCDSSCGFCTRPGAPIPTSKPTTVMDTPSPTPSPTCPVCPVCPVCPIYEDNPNWYLLDDPSKLCDWVAKRPFKRCTENGVVKRSKSEFLITTAQEACEVACFAYNRAN